MQQQEFEVTQAITPLRIIKLVVTGKDGQKRQLTWQQPDGQNVHEAVGKALTSLLRSEQEK
jgi:hypothetical protein